MAIEVFSRSTRTELQALTKAGAPATAILREVARVIGEPEAFNGSAGASFQPRRGASGGDKRNDTTAAGAARR